MSPSPAAAPAADLGDGSVALPVLLAVRGRLGDPLRRMAEGQLGWQPVDDDTAGLVPPAVRLADTTAEPAPRTPTVLLVLADEAPLEVARAVHRLRPSAVVPWPIAPRELAAAVTAAVATPPLGGQDVRSVRVGGAGGGVGTTTVAAAVAGLAAWRGAATLLVSGDATLLPDRAPGIDPSALTAPDLWSRAAPLPGVDRCRAVRATAPAVDVDAVDPRIEVAVLDLGVADDVDVLVCGADARALAALARTTAAAVVVVGDGPVPRPRLYAASGARRRIELPRSARVARAGALGRVPTSLPGRFVRALRPLLPDPRSAARAPARAGPG